MGRARWVSPLWLDILESRAMELAIQIEPGFIGLHPIRVKVGSARLARIFIFIIIIF